MLRIFLIIYVKIIYCFIISLKSVFSNYNSSYFISLPIPSKDSDAIPMQVTICVCEIRAHIFEYGSQPYFFNSIIYRKRNTEQT